MNTTRLRPAWQQILLGALIMASAILSGCGKGAKDKSSASSALPVAPPSERAKVLIADIDKNNDTTTVSELSPPTTHDSFWYQGQGLVPYKIKNSSPGYIFDSWQEGVTPTAGTVVAFKGWVYLRKSGEALIVFSKYLYKLNGQTIHEAYGVKLPKNYDVEARTFPAKWAVSGDELRVTPLGENPDPKYFSTNGAAVFNLSTWKSSEELALIEAEKDRVDRERGLKVLMEQIVKLWANLDGLPYFVREYAQKNPPADGPLSIGDGSFIANDVKNAAASIYDDYVSRQKERKMGWSSFSDYFSRHMSELYGVTEPKIREELMARAVFRGDSLKRRNEAETFFTSSEDNKKLAATLVSKVNEFHRAKRARLKSSARDQANTYVWLVIQNAKMELFTVVSATGFTAEKANETVESLVSKCKTAILETYGDEPISENFDYSASEYDFKRASMQLIKQFSK